MCGLPGRFDPLPSPRVARVVEGTLRLCGLKGAGRKLCCGPSGTEAGYPGVMVEGSDAGSSSRGAKDIGRPRSETAFQA